MQPGKRPPTRSRACRSGKRRYRDKLEAVQALHGAQTTRRFAAKREHTESRFYTCPLCHGWHLTSQPVAAAGIRFETGEAVAAMAATQHGHVIGDRVEIGMMATGEAR